MARQAIQSDNLTTADIAAGNIRAEVMRVGLNASQFAKLIGKPQRWTARRWWGEVEWSLSELDTVAQVLNVSVADLVQEQGIKQNPDRWIAPSGAAARSKGLEPPTF
ncbi:hypothetical protein [Schaalia radingae]|uniref:hypothetical protein n=1 Tax=Schaalia radingae TaxID=131110 RepID=UPI0012FF8DC4|nr:hypothetical protein [Schaalia radingae]